MLTTKTLAGASLMEADKDREGGRGRTCPPHPQPARPGNAGGEKLCLVQCRWVERPIKGPQTAATWCIYALRRLYRCLQPCTTIGKRRILEPSF